MTYKDRIMIAVSIIIAVFALSYTEIFLLSAPAETEFQIGKFDISESNTSTYSYDIKYNKEYRNRTVINITPEELQESPALEKAIIDCAGRIGYYTLCKVSKDDWHKIKNFVDGSFYSYLNSIQETQDGGYIGYGYITKPPRNDHPDGWLVKIDETGNEQWSWAFGEWNRTLMGRGYSADSVVQSDDGGYFMAGTMDVLAGLAAMFVKIDGNGSMQWCKSRTFKGKVASVANSARQTEDDEFLSVQNTADGGYVVAITTSSSSGRSYAKLIKVKGEKTKPVEIPLVSPTVTLRASPIQTLTAMPTETNTVTSQEKAAGFEAVLGITILLAAYTAIYKRR